MKRYDPTPWGPAQTVKPITAGITWVSTASHGGFILSPEWQKLFRAIFPEAQLWAGEGCFEEDVDWAWVVLAFPQFFDRHEVKSAVKAAPWLNWHGKNEDPNTGKHVGAHNEQQ